MVMYFNPIKVLMPLALWLVFAAVVKVVVDVVRLGLRVPTSTLLLFMSGLIIASMALLADLIVRSRGDT
jgi:hypothetical protein